MPREQKRPNLEEMQSHPELIELELVHIGNVASSSGHSGIQADADFLFAQSLGTPEDVIELRGKLQSVSGSTVV